VAREYVIRGKTTNPTAITLAQIVPTASVGVTILRAEVTSTVTTNQQQEIVIVRKSAAATVTAGVVGTTTGNVFKTSLADPNPNLTLSTTGTGIIATAEGTDSETPFDDYYNLQSGFLYLPVPEERINIGPSAIGGLKFPSAPPSGTYAFIVVVMELD
jgi:hypothetical protein